jgi:hypothetical protein
MWYPYSNGFLTVSSSCHKPILMLVAATNQKPIRCEVNIIELSDLTSAECSPTTFVCVCVEFAYCRTQKKLQQFTSPVESCDLLPLCIYQTHLRGKDFSSCPAKNWGRDYSHTTMARSSWSPNWMEKKNAIEDIAFPMSRSSDPGPTLEPTNLIPMRP